MQDRDSGQPNLVGMIVKTGRFRDIMALDHPDDQNDL
jgi:hypothetical protein